jgi:hypothetical protein
MAGRWPPRPERSETAAIAVRWLYTAGGVSVVGAFASLVLVARPAARAAGDVGLERLRELDIRLLTLGGAALAVTAGAGMLDLWRQVGVATGAMGEPGAHHPSAGRPRHGTVWRGWGS